MSKPSVAVLGLHGFLGESTIAAFKSETFKDKFQLPVLAVTRNAEGKESSEYVKYVQGDVTTGREALAKELGNVDVVVSLLGTDPKGLESLEKLIAEVKPKLYIPSQFGTNLEDASRVLPGLLDIKTNHSKKIRDLGIKVIDIYTSLFAGGPFLRKVVGHIGVDADAKTVRYLGSPQTKFSYTSISDIGRVVASVASKALSEEFPDKINVQSGFLTQEDIVKTYEKDNGVTITTKEIVPKEKALEEAKQVWGSGFDPSKFLYYLNVLVSQEAGLVFSKNDDELVNPGESLWKWEKF